MIISQDILRRDAVQVLKQINAQIDEITRDAAGRGIPAEKMTDTSGNYVLTPLLHAKATSLNTLALLQQPKPSKK